MPSHIHGILIRCPSCGFVVARVMGHALSEDAEEILVLERDEELERWAAEHGIDFENPPAEPEIEAGLA